MVEPTMPSTAAGCDSEMGCSPAVAPLLQLSRAAPSMSTSRATHPRANRLNAQHSVKADLPSAQYRRASEPRTVAGLRAQHAAGRPRRRVLLRVLRQLGVQGIGVHRRWQLHAVGHALPVELLILLIVTDVRVLVGGEPPRVARTRRRARLRSNGARSELYLKGLGMGAACSTPTWGLQR